MKVKELIELLSKLDGEKEVLMEQNGGEYISDLENMDICEMDGKVWLLD